MISFCIEFVGSFIEVYIGYGIIETIFSNNSKKLFWGKIILSFILSILIFIINQLYIFSYFTMLLSVIWLAISSTVLYNCKFYYALSLTSFYILCIYLIDFINLSLLNLLTENTFYMQLAGMQGTWIRLIFITIVKTELLIGYFILKHYIISKKILEVYKYLIYLSLMGFLGVFFLVEQTLNSFGTHIAVYWLILLVILILLVCICYYYLENKKEKNRAEIIKMRNKFIEKNYKHTLETYEANFKLFHDLRNHLNTLYFLLKEQQYDDAEAYIESLEIPLKNLKALTWTGNRVIDSILNSKKEEAEKHNILFEANAEYPNNINIDLNDICAILGNLLDNAIEACLYAEFNQKTWINVTIRNINHIIIIKIENSLFVNPILINKRYATLKKDKFLHGWGLKSVEAIAQKYDGTAEFIKLSDSFKATVVLYYSELTSIKNPK